MGVHIEGTLNDHEDEDEFWQLEAAIPEPGDEWLFHLSRYDYSVYLPEGVELSSWPPYQRFSFIGMKTG